MIRRVDRIVLAVVVAAILSVSVLFAQGRRGSSPAPDRGRDRAQSHEEEQAPTFAQVLEKIGLNAKERAAVKEAMERKQTAHQELRRAFGELQRVTGDQEATEAELGRAVKAYRVAQERAERRMAAADRWLASKLSMKSQARCLTLGILDNGIGRGPMMGGGGGGRGGGRGGGGRGGSRGGRGGAAPRRS